MSYENLPPNLKDLPELEPSVTSSEFTLTVEDVMKAFQRDWASAGFRWSTPYKEPKTVKKLSAKDILNDIPKLR